MNREKIILVASGVVLGGGMFTAGYLIGKRKGFAENAELLQTILDEYNAFAADAPRKFTQYTDGCAEGPFEDSDASSETPVYDALVAKYDSAVLTAPDPVIKNVFDTEEEYPEAMDENGWVGEEFPEAPISVISFERVNEAYSDWGITSLVYFDGDDTLVEGETDVVPVEAVEGIIGNATDHFTNPRRGADRAVVYVRNNPHNTIYEVTQDARAFAEFFIGAEAFSQMINDDGVVRKMPKEN